MVGGFVFLWVLVSLFWGRSGLAFKKNHELRSLGLSGIFACLKGLHTGFVSSCGSVVRLSHVSWQAFAPVGGVGGG